MKKNVSTIVANRQIYPFLFSNLIKISSGKRSRAFTAIELLVTIGVFSIIALLAVPSFTGVLYNARLTTGTDALVNAFNYARNTALNNSMNITVCPYRADNSTSCGNSWTSGWIIIAQPSSGAATLLKSQQFPSTAPTINANVLSVTFDSHGLANTQNNFTICDSRGASFAQSITVMATGYIQAGNTSGQAVWDNSALVCS